MVRTRYRWVGLLGRQKTTLMVLVHVVVTGHEGHLWVLAAHALVARLYKQYTQTQQIETNPVIIQVRRQEKGCEKVHQ